MTEQKPQRKGRDFLIGFLANLLLIVLMILLLTGIIDSPSGSVFALLSIIVGGVSVILPAIAFIRRRKFIGIGMLAALVAVPLLLVGSCFAYVLYGGGLK